MYSIGEHVNKIKFLLMKFQIILRNFGENLIEKSNYAKGQQHQIHLNYR